MKERSRGKKAELTSEEVKAQIISAAKSHFASHGFQGASLKDIAAQASVAGSLINYHFKDKAGLFRACMENFMHDRMAAILRILDEPQNADELKVRLLLFVEEIMASIVAFPEEFDIVDRELRAKNVLIMELFAGTMVIAYQAVIEFFQKAQERKLIESSLDPMIVASILFTSTCDLTRKQHLSTKFFGLSFEQPEWRKKVAEHIVHVMMKGVVK